jgi:Domain of unknown function (DUF397)
MDLTSATWRKSTYSSNNGGNCVMVAVNLPGVVALQDSKNPGPALVVEPEVFAAFVQGIKSGEFSNL